MENRKRKENTEQDSTFTSSTIVIGHLTASGGNFKRVKPKEQKKESTSLISIPESSTLDILDSSFNDAKPDAILALDLDDTLLDLKKSESSRSICLAEPTKICSLLQKAKAENIMIVLVTARFYEAQKVCPVYLDVHHVLDHIGKHFFSAIYYTNNTLKSDALRHLNRLFLSHEDSTHDLICLVDDQERNLIECQKKGFQVVNITEQDAYSKIKEFISGPEEEDDLEEENEETPTEDLDISKTRTPSN